MWWTRRRGDEDFSDELKAHLQIETDRLIAGGMSPSEAHAAARRAFGNVTRAEERFYESRRLIWFDDVRRDTRYAVRTLAKTPGFALTAIAVLAMGIGVNTALFTVTRQVLLKTLPVVNPQELVEIDCNSRPGVTGGGGSCMHSYPAFQLLSARHEGLTGAFAFSPVPGGLVASFDGRREVITGQLASANIFSVLGVAPVAGRLLIEADDRPGASTAAVLGYGYWLRSFGGSRDVVGRTLDLNGHAVTITGVLPRAYLGVTFGEPYDVTLPLGSSELFRARGILTNRLVGWLSLMGRLQPGISADDLGKHLEPVFQQSIEEAFGSVPPAMRARLDLTLDNIRVEVRSAALGASSSMRRTLQPTLRVLTVVVALVLCIACANLANLFLAQALNRQREFSVRLALGAGQARLVRQVLTESLLVSTAGGSLGLLLAQWLGPLGFTLATDDTGLRAVDLGADVAIFAFTASMTVLVGLAIGLVSIMRASSLAPQGALRNVRAQGSPRLNGALLSAQIALTLALVGTAALFLQTLANFHRLDVGFRTDRLFTVRMDPGFGRLERPRRMAYVEEALTAIRALPGIEAASTSNLAMGGGVSMSLNLDVPGFAGPASESSSGISYVGADYIRTLGLTLLAGRDFDVTTPVNSPRMAIVNESFATHFFGTLEVLGRSFAFLGPGNPPITIQGVTRDARDLGVKRATEPIIYLPYGPDSATVTFTIRAQRSLESVVDAVCQTLLHLDPSVGILRIATADAPFDNGLRRERLLAVMGTAFGALALLLVAVGLFGMLNAMVARRTAEIGIRMALGATGLQIGWMLARETLTVLITGVGVGLAGYLVAARLVRSQLFGVEPADPTAAASAVLGLLVIAALAVWLPARRAANLDPQAALRCE